MVPTSRGRQPALRPFPLGRRRGTGLAELVAMLHFAEQCPGWDCEEVTAPTRECYLRVIPPAAGIGAALTWTVVKTRHGLLVAREEPRLQLGRFSDMPEALEAIRDAWAQEALPRRRAIARPA